MARDRATRVSKYLALRLRHAPGPIGLRLDEQGWGDIAALLAGAAADGFPITPDELRLVVATNDKQRYEIDATGRRIRARQGHSVAVELGLDPSTPPDVLYHGTVSRALDRIRAEGLLPMQRRQVHLSADRATATAVGARRGAPVVLEVDAGAMAAEGQQFWRTANGVWLTAAVAPRFLRVPDGGRATAGQP